VLLSSPKPAAGIDVDRLPVTARADGAVLGTRDLAVPLDLWRNVLWIVNDFAVKRGYPTETGFVVIPGNLTGIHAGRPGRYEVDYGPLGRVAFEVLPCASQSKR
jgi:2-keto-4-pentenoate hydratase